MKDRNIQRGVGVVYFILGLAMIASDNPFGLGYVVLFLGLAWMSGTIGREGESWSDKNPEIARWLFGGLLVLSVSAAIGTLFLKFR